MNAVDTNVLVYAHDKREPQKQAIAVALIGSLTEGVLLWQVACEYLAASRKLEPMGFRLEDAWQDIRDLRTVWSFALPSESVLDGAQELVAKYSLSFWDGLILAACMDCGVSQLYSEDLHAGSVIGSVQIVNPFISAS